MSDVPSRVPAEIVLENTTPGEIKFFEQFGIVAAPVIFSLAESYRVSNGEVQVASDQDTEYWSHVYDLNVGAELDSELSGTKLIAIEQIDQDGTSTIMFYSLMAPHLGVAYIEIGAESIDQHINRVATSMYHAQNQTLEGNPAGNPLVVAENINRLILPQNQDIIQDLDELRLHPDLKELFIIFADFMLQPDHKTESRPGFIKIGALIMLIYVMSTIDRRKAKVSIEKGLDPHQAINLAKKKVAKY